jgi:hypothetical protein
MLLLPYVIVSLLASFTANAADWFGVTLRVTCKYVNGSDRISRRTINNATLIQDYIATQILPPSAKDLKLGYDPHADKISIVDTTSGESVLDVYTFDGSISAANSIDSIAERQVFVYPGDSSHAIGTAQLSERLTRDDEGVITRFASTGRLQLAYEANGDLPAEVCSGSLSVGRKLKISVP